MVCIKIYVHHSFYFIFQPDGCVELNFLLLGLKTNHSLPTPQNASALINLTFLSIPPRNSFKNVCCLLSTKPAKDLALVDLSLMWYCGPSNASNLSLELPLHVSHLFYFIYCIEFPIDPLLYFCFIYQKSYLFGIISKACFLWYSYSSFSVGHLWS